METFVLALLAALAGFIDAIAGGAALITLPALSAVLGPGARAIGTAKLVGATAAVTAFLVLWAKGQRLDRIALTFGAWIGLGSLAGSTAAPHVDPEAFRYLMIGVCPLLLYVVLQKDRWLVEPAPNPPSQARIALPGLAVGLYDGFFGPAGGTFMFLALVLVMGRPLLTALITAKFVNAVAGCVALANYARQDLVSWRHGSVMAAAVLAGAAFGARQAAHSGSRLVRPMLVVVTVLLLIRLALPS
jgi:uncharacterized membrane protein YfcA